ncbi:uncharacterized protein [Amphiura filiformis]|uniref:uncharacterized protein n=1 Tax=Amphiura filiformis TaxID=82378 RepID=UPI003B217AC0
MEEEYGQGSEIVLSDWQAEFETYAERWWDRINARLEHGRPPLAPNVPVGMMEDITEVFWLMQAELDQGRPLNISEWDSKAHELTIDWWNTLQTRLDRRVGADVHDMPDDPPTVLTNQVCDLFDRMEEEQESGVDIKLSKWQEEFETMVEGWWDRITGRITNNMGTDRLQLAVDVSDSVMEDLTAIFPLMQAEYDQGRPLNISAWHSEAHKSMSNWWNRLIQRLDRRVGRDHGIPREIHPRVTEQVCDLFDRMQVEQDAGNNIILSEWQEEFETMVEGVWDRIVKRVVSGNKRPLRFPDDIPSNTMAELTEIFDLMQIELDEGRPLNITSWDDEAHQTTSEWWANTILRLERRIGGSHGLPREVTPIMTIQVCDIFDNMQMEMDRGHDILLSYWRGEFEKVLEQWWDVVNRKLDNRGPHSQPHWQTTGETNRPSGNGGRPGVRPNGPRPAQHAEKPQYDVLCQGKGFEARHYHKSVWVRTIVNAPSYDEAVTMCTPLLLRYMNGNNGRNEDLGLTLPHSVRIVRSHLAATCERNDYACTMYLPRRVHENPPIPTDSNLHIVRHPTLVRYAHAFPGFVMNQDIHTKLSEFLDALTAAKEVYNATTFHVDIFDNPWKILNRHNEISVPMPVDAVVPTCSLVSLPEPEPEPISEPEPEPVSEPEPEPVSEPEPEPVFEPEPEPSPLPTDWFIETVEPEPTDEWFLTVEPEPEPEPEFWIPEPEPEPIDEPDLNQDLNGPGFGVNEPSVDLGCTPGVTCPRFQVASEFVDYQERTYSASRWVCVDIVDACDITEAKETSESMLHTYFQGPYGNLENIQMTPTTPFVIQMSVVDMNREACDKTYTSCMYIPEEHQGSPPTPQDASLFISDVPMASKFVYPFTVRPTPNRVSNMAVLFLRTLEFDRLSYDSSSAYIAYYETSDNTQDKYEIWVSE